MKVYQYEKCESCKKAIRWLNEKGIEHKLLPIREKTPSKKEFLQMIKSHDGQLKKLFNTSSKDYRDPQCKRANSQSLTGSNHISFAGKRKFDQKTFFGGRSIGLAGIQT
jgi:arsenate reductase-like glutaredoxin family protein